MYRLHRKTTVSNGKITVSKFSMRIQNSRDIDSSSHSIYKVNKLKWNCMRLSVYVPLLFDLKSSQEIVCVTKRFTDDWTINKWRWSVYSISSWLSNFDFFVLFESLNAYFNALVSHTYPPDQIDYQILQSKHKKYIALFTLSICIRSRSTLVKRILISTTQLRWWILQIQNAIRKYLINSVIITKFGFGEADLFFVCPHAWSPARLSSSSSAGF